MTTNNQIINVVHLHTLYSNYKTGIDRYFEMYTKGFYTRDEHCCIRSHTVFFTDDRKILFPQINMDKNGEISAIIPFPQNDTLLFKSPFWKGGYIKIVSGLLQPYLENKFNLIYQYHNLYLSSLAEDLKERFGGKIITHLHCIPWKFKSSNNEQGFNKLYKLYEDKKFDLFKQEENSTVNYNASDKIICLSKAAKEYLINIHHVDEDKMVIIPNGLSIDSRFENNKRKTKKLEILYVGKVSKDKGIYELLNALVKVKNEGFDFELKIAGSCTPFLLRKIRNDYKNIDIRYLGQISFGELQRLYSTCTIGVIPSLHEQCSYVALEMAFYGIPLIVSNVDALAEMFEHEKNALLTPLMFDPDFGLKANEDYFVSNIIRLLKDKKLRAVLSENIYQLYTKKFMLDNMMKQTIDVYQQLI